jgi:hypothetical protein
MHRISCRCRHAHLFTSKCRHTHRKKLTYKRVDHAVEACPEPVLNCRQCPLPPIDAPTHPCTRMHTLARQAVLYLLRKLVNNYSNPERRAKPARFAQSSRSQEIERINGACARVLVRDLRAMATPDGYRTAVVQRLFHGRLHCRLELIFHFQLNPATHKQTMCGSGKAQNSEMALMHSRSRTFFRLRPASYSHPELE